MNDPSIMIIYHMSGCRAFQNGRQLASAGLHTALLAVLHRQAVEVEAAAVFTALKKVAVNDDICQEIADGGGVELCLQV